LATVHVDSASPPPAADALHPEPGELVDRLGWLVSLRWKATAGTAAVVAAAAALQVVAEVATLFGLVALVAAGNVALARLAERADPTTPLVTLQNQLALQLAFDVTVLVCMLHYSGGADNPFIMLSVVHMAFAGMLLPLYKALAIGLFMGGLYAAMVLAEAMGLVGHHPLFLDQGARGVTAYVHLWNSPAYTLGYLGAYAMTGLGIIVLVHGLVHRIRRAEAERRHHVRVAQERERLARIGALVAGVAHTIRNPLHGVLSCVEMLGRRAEPADTRTAELVDLMAEGVSKIETVTSRLLTLARESRTAPAPTDIAALVQDASQFAAMRAQVRDVPVSVDAVPLPHLAVDAERLSEAIANVVDNAVDACVAGGSVAVRVSDGGAGGVRIEIEDTGSGIADADLDRIFDPFFTTKPVGEGTGLGLAITRQVVEDHGGSIAVTSRPGQGTTVAIDLPGAPARRQG